MTRLTPHTYIDGLGVCTECLLEIELSTHTEYDRLALVSYSLSNGIWSPCRIGIAGQQKIDGDWYAVEPPRVRTWMYEHRIQARQASNSVNYLEFRRYEQLWTAYQEVTA